MVSGAPRVVVVAFPKFTQERGGGECMSLVHQNSETGRIRFRRVRFQTPNSVSLLAPTEFRGENSASSSQPIICVPNRTHRVFQRTHRVCPKNSVRLSEFSSPKQYCRNSTSLPFPKNRAILRFAIAIATTDPKNRAILEIIIAISGRDGKYSDCDSETFGESLRGK